MAGGRRRAARSEEKKAGEQFMTANPAGAAIAGHFMKRLLSWTL